MGIKTFELLVDSKIIEMVFKNIFQDKGRKKIFCSV
jgi:hypothetical protein